MIEPDGEGTREELIGTMKALEDLKLDTIGLFEAEFLLTVRLGEMEGRLSNEGLLSSIAEISSDTLC
jgi:hypothetical protein